MPVDVFSVTLPGRRILSLLTQTFGFLSDCDLGTEHLRRMGDSRFVWGAVREREPSCNPVDLPGALTLATWKCASSTNAPSSCRSRSSRKTRRICLRRTVRRTRLLVLRSHLGMMIL
jgi:hypothetical protein